MRTTIMIIGIVLAFVVLAPPVGAQTDLRLDLWVKNLNHPQLAVRKSAVRKLGELGDKRAVEHLLPLLNAEKTVIRRLSAGSLGQIKDPSAIGALKKVALNDNQKSVRRAAARAAETLQLVLEREQAEEEKARQQEQEQAKRG